MGSRLLISMVLSGLCVLMTSLSVQAANPAVTGAQTIQSVTTGGVTTWQTKVNGTVANLPANATNIMIQIDFTKIANGAKVAKSFLTINQAVAFANPLNFDTGFQALTPAPAAGDKYQATINVSYKVGNNTFALVPTGTAQLIPVSVVVPPPPLMSAP